MYLYFYIKFAIDIVSTQKKSPLNTNVFTNDASAFIGTVYKQYSSNTILVLRFFYDAHGAGKRIPLMPHADSERNSSV